MANFTPPYFQDHEYVEDLDFQNVNLPLDNLMNIDSPETQRLINKQKIGLDGCCVHLGRNVWNGEWKFIFGLSNQSGNELCGIYIGASLVDYRPILYSALCLRYSDSSTEFKTGYLFLESCASCHIPVQLNSCSLYVNGKADDVQEQGGYSHFKLSAEYELTFGERLRIPIILDSVSAKLSM